MIVADVLFEDDEVVVFNGVSDRELEELVLAVIGDRCLSKNTIREELGKRGVIVSMDRLQKIISTLIEDYKLISTMNDCYRILKIRTLTQQTP